jgi:hypothetical protein
MWQAFENARQYSLRRNLSRSKDLFDHIIRGLVAAIVGAAPSANCDSEVPASPADVADLLSVLNDSLLSTDLTLILGHLDPPDYPPPS